MPCDLPNGDHCQELLGQGGCSLCEHHRKFIKQEKNYYQDILPSSFSRRKTLQEDLFLTSFDLYKDINLEPHINEAISQLPFSKDGNLEIDLFKEPDWKHYIIGFPHANAKFEEFLPLPHPYKLPFATPDLTRTQPDSVNAGASLDCGEVHDHYRILSWFVDHIHSLIKSNKSTYESKWQLKILEPDLARVKMIPWGHFIASSLITAIHEANSCQLPSADSQVLTLTPMNI